MKLFFRLVLLLSPLALFAGEGSTDIVPRTINFLIFAAILYRYVAGPLKNFFKERREEIVTTLKSIQEKVEESKKAKAEALKKLEDSKVLAKSIVEDAKKEAELITAKIKNELENELELLEKYNEERKEIERRKMVKAVVAETVNSLFKENLQTFDNSELVNIVMKKVA
jgi:F-type H+-transporting ATPase subunit b